jgi:hypothetical protein
VSSFSSISSALGLAQILTTFAEVIAFVAVFGALATLFIVAISNSKDTDAGGSRPMAAYLFSGGFIFLWIAYLGVDTAANSLIQALGDHPSPFPGVPGPSYRDQAIRACVLGGLLLVIAGGAAILHLRKGASLAEAEGDANGPTKRVMRTYVALVSFLAIVILVVALVATGWLVAAEISPTIFLAGASRTDITRALLEALVLVLLAGAIFTSHQRYAPERLRLIGDMRTGRAPSDVPPTPSAA